MKTFGIRTKLLVFVCFSFSQIAISQNNIDPCLCNRKDCGDIIASFKLVSNSTVVCDGYEFEVQNNSTIPDVSYYIWSWGDGTRDSVTTTTNQKHIYNIPVDKVCLDNQTTYQICLLAVKRCGTIYSCHNNNSPVTVIHRPVAKFDYTNSVCVDKKVDFINKSCNVDETLTDAYLWTFHDGMTSTSKNASKTYSTPGTYTVKLKVKNGCGEHEITKTIEVVDFPDAVVNISETAKDSVVCVGDVITLIDKSNQWSKNNYWTFPNNNTILTDTMRWKLDYSIRKLEKFSPFDTIIRLDTIRFTVLQTGTYNFKLTSTNACGTKDWLYSLKVVAAPAITLNTPPTFCENATFTPIVNVIGEVNSYNWTFPGGSPSTSNQKNPGPISYSLPGTYTITLKADAECDTITRSVQLMVNSRDPVTIANPNKIFCQSSSPDTLQADRTGGTWSGQGITNTNLGIFDPSILSSGNYPITYTVGPVGCQSITSITLQVVASENVVISDTILCENTSITSLIANPSSGVWSGSTSVTLSGLFDPSMSGIGEFPINYTYTDVNGCVIEKKLVVTVEAFPTISSMDTSIVCIGSGSVSLENILNTNANPSGGMFSFFLENISVQNMIDVQNYNVSVLPVTIIYTRNQCEVKDSAYIRFIEKPILSITSDTTLCIFDSLFTLKTNVTGGTWSGPGVDPDTGVINLKNVGEGLTMYTYSFQPNTSCAQTQTVNLDIKNPGVNLDAGPNQQTCEGTSSFTLSGNSPANGLWSGEAIDPVTGNIDVSQLTLDSLYTYTYCLTDVNLQGCKACRPKTFIVHSLPAPMFYIDGLTCINEDITIINQSLGNNIIQFELGDGTTSNADTITHQYTNKGTYSITLQVTNEFMCSASISEEIYLTNKPISAFTLLDDEGCAPFELMITNQSSGDGISYEWNINNTSYTDVVPPPIIFDRITKDSTFVISLAVTNQCGTVLYEDIVLVHPYPIVDYGVSEQSGCSPLTIDFANTSVGNPTTFFWNLGNGNIYNDSIPPTQIYTTTSDKISTYSVLFVGTNLCGTDSLRKEITVYPPDITAFIEAPGLSLCQYDTLILTAYSTPGAVNTWKLISPDGTLFGASGDVAVFDMGQPGIYTAVLYASRCGSDTDTVLVNVLPAPIVDFDLPTFACVGSKVSFTNQATGIGGVSWDYGDGVVDSSGKHVYKTPGIYTVTLTAFSLVNNCPVSISKTISVIGLPTASFFPSTFSGCEPLEITFTNNSTSNSIYDWNFGDLTSNSSGISPTHLFQKDGTFEVKLTVYDAFGCFSDTSILNIIVHPKPESKFIFPNQKYCHRYDSIPFTNLSTGSVAQQWLLNGASYSSSNITWLPIDSGNVNVILVAESEFGCIDSSSNTIPILPSAISNFVTDEDNGCEDLKVDFNNISTNAQHYIWNFTNGTSSVDKNPTYTFTSPGTFNVRLVSLTDNGCPADTFIKSITVYPRPVADFVIQKDSVCGIPMRVTFLNNSRGNIDNNWTINETQISQDPDFTEVFNTASENDITLIVKNEFLCSDTLTKILDIYLQPIANFEISEQACEGDVIDIVNKSTNALSYIWDIEGKDKTTISEPQLVFDSSGIYHISLIAIFNAFCKDTFSLTTLLKIYDSPIADFEYQGDYDNNVLGEVGFNNLSVDYDRSLWNFGDGNLSDEENPVHDYDINRNLLVTLTAYNDNNGNYTCIDSITKPVAPEWITTFFAPNALSPEYGEGDVKVFKPVGIGLAVYQISVYSPWGQAVWTSNKLENTSPLEVWDGMYNNSIVPQGAYSWIADVTFVNGIRKVFKGSVTVVR